MAEEDRFVSLSADGEIYVTDTSEGAQGNGYLASAVMAEGRLARLERLQGGIAQDRETVKWIAHPCIAPDGSCTAVVKELRPAAGR